MASLLLFCDSGAAAPKTNRGSVMSRSDVKASDEAASDGWSAFEVWHQTIHEPRRQRRGKDDLGRRAAQVDNDSVQFVVDALQKAHL